jgi:Glycosyl hydrolase 2 galactose-binding domain-like
MDNGFRPMHTIRLRGPWQFEPVAVYIKRAGGDYVERTTDLPPGAKSTMPADWSDAFGPHFLGRVCYRRTFQKPTGLGGGDQVWLVVEPARSLAAVELNGTPLGTMRANDAAARFDITRLLADRNALAVEVSHPAVDANGRPTEYSDIDSPGGLVGEVRLEIQERVANL